METLDAVDPNALAIYRACEHLLEALDPRRSRDLADVGVNRAWKRISVMLGAGEIAPPPDAAPATPTRMSVRCLGATRVTVNGRPVDWPRRSRLVFMYLLAHRTRPVMRDELIEAFWPGSPPENGRNCLNVALSHLRRPLRDVLGDRAFVVFGCDAYHLADGLDLEVDWDEFHALKRAGDELMRADDFAAAAQSYRAAAALYRGDLFADEPYESWISSLRLAMEGTLLRVLERLSECEARLEDPTACAATCRDLLERAPYREDIHRRLMRCYAALGQESRAVEHFRACERTLSRDLGTGPGEATRAVYEQLLPRLAAEH